jgi:hypothetical protein
LRCVVFVAKESVVMISGCVIYHFDTMFCSFCVENSIGSHQTSGYHICQRLSKYCFSPHLKVFDPSLQSAAHPKWCGDWARWLAPQNTMHVGQNLSRKLNLVLIYLIDIPK